MHGPQDVKNVKVPTPVLFYVKFTPSTTIFLKYILVLSSRAVTVPGPSKAWVCGRLLAGTAGSNNAGGMGISILCLLCVMS